MTLINTKQLQDWYFQRCNGIERWTLWNYSYWCRFKATGQTFSNAMACDDPATVERLFKDIIDYNLDGIDTITLGIEVYGIIDYKLHRIGTITLGIELLCIVFEKQ